MRKFKTVMMILCILPIAFVLSACGNKDSQPNQASTVPSEVRNLTATVHGNSITLKWDHPVDFGGASSVSFTAKRHDGFPLVNTSATQVTFTYQQMDTTFNFHVMANNSVGSGPISTIDVITGTGANHTASRNIDVSGAADFISVIRDSPGSITSGGALRWNITLAQDRSQATSEQVAARFITTSGTISVGGNVGDITRTLWVTNITATVTLSLVGELLPQNCPDMHAVTGHINVSLAPDFNSVMRGMPTGKVNDGDSAFWWIILDDSRAQATNEQVAARFTTTSGTIVVTGWEGSVNRVLTIYNITADAVVSLTGSVIPQI